MATRGAQSAAAAASTASPGPFGEQLHAPSSGAEEPGLDVRLRADRTEDGKRLKILTIVDEYTRECLDLVVARSITAQAVLVALERLVARRGAPESIRSDNGPEFIAAAVRAWLERAHVGTLFVAPGSPWENAYIETFNGKLQDELLQGELFTSLIEARWLIERWRRAYNEERPHSSLEYQTPARFAAACTVACRPNGADARRPFQLI